MSFHSYCYSWVIQICACVGFNGNFEFLWIVLLSEKRELELYWNAFHYQKIKNKPYNGRKPSCFIFFHSYFHFRGTKKIVSCSVSSRSEYYIKHEYFLRKQKDILICNVLNKIFKNVLKVLMFLIVSYLKWFFSLHIIQMVALALDLCIFFKYLACYEIIEEKGIAFIDFIL